MTTNLFENLLANIGRVHHELQSTAAKAVNISLTCRNWIIGWHLHEYELHGQDRADYGAELFAALARRLSLLQIPNCNRSRLYRYRDFYRLYPHLHVAFPAPCRHLLGASSRESEEKVATVSPQLPSEKVATLSPLSANILLERLSYSHIELLLEIDHPLKRAFYEIESLKGGWSVRELKRQIASLYYERSGLSLNQEALSRLANEAAEREAPSLIIRDPLVFNFLGLRPHEVLPESKLEAALIDRLEEFLRELGHGFCFEARQKRIIIGGEHYFVDLVFYHRVLKCHVLVELKVDAFHHEHLGQLNTYVSYYRAHEMTEGDQPPVGLLLCTGKNHALVEYALAGLDNRLFVSNYQMELPNPEKLSAYLDEQRRILEGGEGR